MPTLPILPGLNLPGATQGGALTSPAAPADPTADPNAAGPFLDQLAAALASLTPSQPAAPEVAVPQDQVPDQGEKDSQTSEQTMADLAASFGLLPMPLLMPLAITNVLVQSTGGHVDATASPATTEPPVLPVPALPVQVATTEALATSTSDALATAEPHAEGAPIPDDQPAADTALPRQATTDASPGSKTPALAPAEVEPAMALPRAESQASVPTPPLATPSVEQSSVGAAAQPVRHADKDQEPHRSAELTPPATASTEDMRAARLGDGHDERNQPRQAGAITTTTAVAHSQAAQQPASGSEAHAGGEHHGHGQTAQQDSAAPTPEVSSADPTVQPAPFPAMAGMAAANAPSAANAAHTREVVGQIAQQAELYRLPGGRGVRIQLHPDGLGGVEVTLRYGAAGALELHVNVEHAGTGALVQAGWSDLRDALSQQGISPDRLVMSVSGPDGASLSSDSGSFGSGTSGSFSQDAGPSGFGQSASQGQQEHQPAPARPRWTPIVNATPQEPEFVAPASSSRIDLRV